MAQLLEPVKPGEIITADKWNLLVGVVNELLSSGQTTGIKILALLPEGTVAEPIRVGTVLQITGQNFGYSIGQSSVTFIATSGSVVIEREQMLTGSSDTRLVLVVPPIPGLTQTGAIITLRVSNGLAADERTVFVMPIVVTLQGDVFVEWRPDVIPNPKPNPLQSSAPAEFAYQLKTETNMPATFQLSAAISDATAVVPSELVPSIEFRDEQGNVVPNKRVEMGKSETRNIVVRIPKIPADWANQSFSLTPTATAGKVTGSVFREFTVGVSVNETDPDIEPQQTAHLVLDTATGNVEIDPLNGRLEGTTILLKPGRQMIVIFNVKLKQAGNHDLTIQPKAGTTLTGWSPQLVATATPLPGPVQNAIVQIGVTASIGATPNGRIVFRIKRQGATKDWLREFNVQLLA